jgi:integrase/recombinase XerD
MALTRRKIPDPVIRPVTTTAVQPAADLRQSRIDEYFQARSLAPNTEKSYRHDLSYFLNWTDQPWAAITPRLVAQFKTYLLRQDLAADDSGRSQRALSNASVRRILGTLIGFLDWMVVVQYLPHNPSRGIELPKLPEPEAQNLTAEQMAKIYQAVEQTGCPLRDRALIVVLAHGLRAASVAALNLDDYQHSALHVRLDKNQGHRVVPLAADAVDAIERYLTWRFENGETLRQGEALFVATRRNRGGRMSYQGIRKVIDQVASLSGVEFHAHQLRHTFGTNLAIAGVDSGDGMTLMGHKSINTYRRYTSAAQEVRAARAFYEAIGEDVPEPRMQGWHMLPED